VPEPAVARRGREAAETDCGQPAPAQPVAGAMAAQSSPGTSSSNAIPPGPAVSGAAVVHIRPHLSFVGVHFFAHWLDHQAAFDLVVAQLTQAIEPHKHTHPDDDFALLHHREQTLRHRFQALFFAPLFGIEHLTEFDTREHPLATLLGHSYQSATLTQFLGPLERVGADEALVPTLVPAQAGQLT
jgi:hypothetical protein